MYVQIEPGLPTHPPGRLLNSEAGTDKEAKKSGKVVFIGATVQVS
jgi:hypothetical protein